MNATRSASCSRFPDSRRSERIGRLSRPVRCSGARESWESAITGTLSSRARIFSAAAHLTDLLDAVGAHVLGAHQLDVVEDDQRQAAVAVADLLRVQAPRLGPQVEACRGPRTRRSTAARSRARCRPSAPSPTRARATWPLRSLSEGIRARLAIRRWASSESDISSEKKATGRRSLTRRARRCWRRGPTCPCPGGRRG